MQNIIQPPVKYPAWQSAIRAAQTVQREADRLAAEEAAKQRAEMDATEGRNLARVLSLVFGIESAPNKNEVLRDGFRFSLRTGGRFGGVTYSEGPTNHNPKTCIWFTLCISKLLPGPLDEEDVDEYFRWPRLDSEITATGGMEIDRDWSDYRTLLADELDLLEENYKVALPQYEAWKCQREEPPRVASAQKPTLEQEFFALFKRMVRKYQSHDDYDLDLESGE